MPIDQWLKDFTPGDDFDFDTFRASALAEAEKDRTSANAAISLRDAELATTRDNLTKAQAAAWEAYQNGPAGDTAGQESAEPDENSVDAIRARVFKPYTRK